MSSEFVHAGGGIMVEIKNPDSATPTAPPPLPSPSPITDPKLSRPTAAESLKKQREADKLARLEKAAGTPDSITPKTPKEPKVKASKPSTNGKKPVAKKAAKPTEERAPRERKGGLRTMQLRALFVLGSSNRNDYGLPLQDLAKEAGISKVVMNRGLGAIDPACRADHDERNKFKSLLSLGYMKVSKKEWKDGEANIFELTSNGRKAYEKNCKEKGNKLPKKHVGGGAVKKAKPKKKATAK